LPADALIRSGPQFAPATPAGPLQALAVRVGFGHLPAAGRIRWTRDGPDAVALGLTHDAWRGKVSDAWRLANPDLRVSGQSLGWRDGYAAASREATHDAARLQIPVLMLLPQAGRASAESFCQRLPRCESRTIAGARPALHLEQDAMRKVWLEAVSGRVLSLSPLGKPAGSP
jgi:lysophospholipase